MEIYPRSLLSRLLGAAWTILLIAGLLWLAARLLADTWLWLLGFVVLVALIRLGLWTRRWYRDDW